uniref:NADH-ubiquinone oxidoreductase chain 4 n=1 Tax=Callipogon relictus TaxID=1105317 RepID=A0A343VZ30_9CUCU|nr:NADH dehydrogenase subunit 4 [Callipogon relictus]AVR43551.1 NADH dehydrogenase subunit 4 [Callipogon relictus]WDD39340.1 NADH dehydrogenase subunit 4 [Callipogon relictus]
MKIFMSLMFMIPLCFSGNFWLVQILFFFLTFIYMLHYSFGESYMYVSYFLGCDFLSFILILLSFWVCSLMILASEKIHKMDNYSNLFIFVMIVLMISLFLTFGSLNLFVFYLFFEISLIPTLILIVGWGYQPERIEAGVYLLFYTLLVSLPMMVSIFFYYSSFNTLDFSLMESEVDSVLMYLCMNSVFFVKIPMFFIHLWLPKAHVEAPVAGSMILAGVMLKLGGYGLLRVMKLFLLVGLKINIVIVVVSLVGGFIVSLICVRQSDVKSLIAYSSVAHMGLALGGIMTLSVWGYWGSLLMMVAHGLCSSGLFCLANITYERVGSRSLYLNKGFLSIMPSMSLWWFLLCSSNMAAPPSLNLAGEIVLINSLIGFSWLSMIFLSLMSFFSAVYSLFLYSFSQHGCYYSGLYSLYQGVFREYLLLFLHWVPLNLIIMGSSSFSSWL